MQITVLKSKLHRGCVTLADLNYEGSLAIDEDLMDAVGIHRHEQIHVFNINNGERFVTYAIPAERGSKTMMVNGAAARLAQINDRIIIVAYGMIDEKEKAGFQPRVVLLGEQNQILKGPESR